MKYKSIIKHSIQLIAIFYLTVSLASPIPSSRTILKRSNNGNIHSSNTDIQILKDLIQSSIQNPSHLVFSAEFHKEYVFVDRLLGEGSNGVVYQAKYKNQDIAIKIGYADNYKSCQEIPDVHSIQMAKKLNRKIGLIQYIGCGLEHGNALYFFATEMITNTNGGPEFFHYLVQNGKQSEIDALEYLHQLATTLDQLHYQGIIHGDIKTENILIRQNRDLVLIDFGNSFILHKNELWNKFHGTSKYASPQAKASIRDATKFYDARKDDVYALGTATLVMLGCFSFKGVTLDRSVLGCHVPDTLVLLLRGMLNANEYSRFTTTQILNEIRDIRMKHPNMIVPVIEEKKERSVRQNFNIAIEKIVDDIILGKYITGVKPDTLGHLNAIWNESQRKLVVDLNKLNWESSSLLHPFYSIMLGSYTNLAKHKEILNEAKRVSLNLPQEVHKIMEFNTNTTLDIKDIIKDLHRYKYLENPNNAAKWAVVENGIHDLKEYFANIDVEFSCIGIKAFTHTGFIDIPRLVTFYDKYRPKYEKWVSNIDKTYDFQ